MSELAAICGRRLVEDNIAPKCLPKWNANSSFLQGLKARMPDPHTKTPLRSSERRDSHWLYLPVNVWDESINGGIRERPGLQHP